MKAILRGSAVLVMALMSVPGYTAERLVPYDDFNATHIDLDKWVGGEYRPAVPSASTEAIQQIQDNRLRMVYRSYGPTDSDSGRLRSELVLMFRDLAAVTAIQAAVQVTDVATTGCPGNSVNTVAWAMLGGRFFGSAASTPDGEVKNMVASSWGSLGCQVPPARLTSSRHEPWSSIVQTGPARPACSHAPANGLHRRVV
jgi:hypothetical protein